MLQGDNPGKMDRRITLQSRTVTPNVYSEPIETWEDVCTVWAAVDYPKTGSDEMTEKGLNIARQRVEFTIRYRLNVGFVERIIYNSETYDIERIAEVGRSQYLKITAEKRK
jgi:SPP1 family predicted phage head-tail adaptor